MIADRPNFSRSLADLRRIKILELKLVHRTISVVGLGYLGLPLAVGFGKSRPLIDFDIKPTIKVYHLAMLHAGHGHKLEVS